MTERVWASAVGVYETKDDLVVSCDIPGVREKEVSVSITGEMLTVKGERKPAAEAQDESDHHLEPWYGKFERHLRLPIPVQADKVKATYRDGVLEIELPKAEGIKPRGDQDRPAVRRRACSAARGRADGRAASGRSFTTGRKGRTSTWRR